MLHQFEDGLHTHLLDAEFLGNCRDEQPRIADRSQRNEANAIDKVFTHLRSNLQAQACLTNASFAHQYRTLRTPLRIERDTGNLFSICRLHMRVLFRVQ